MLHGRAQLLHDRQHSAATARHKPRMNFTKPAPEVLHGGTQLLHDGQTGAGGGYVGHDALHPAVAASLTQRSHHLAQLAAATEESKPEKGGTEQECMEQVWCCAVA